MQTKDDVRRFCLAHPDVTEVEPFRFAVGTRALAWPYPERLNPKRPRVPRYDIFVVWLGNLGEVEALLLGEPDLCFSTDHYSGYPAVLVRLEAASESRLRDLIADAAAAAKRDVSRPREPRRRTAGPIGGIDR